MVGFVARSSRLGRYIDRVAWCGGAGGRGEATSFATTFVVDADAPLTPAFVALLRRSSQPVPPALLGMAAAARARSFEQQAKEGIGLAAAARVRALELQANPSAREDLGGAAAGGAALSEADREKLDRMQLYKDEKLQKQAQQNRRLGKEKHRN